MEQSLLKKLGFTVIPGNHSEIFRTQTLNFFVTEAKKIFVGPELSMTSPFQLVYVTTMPNEHYCCNLGCTILFYNLL